MSANGAIALGISNPTDRIVRGASRLQVTSSGIAATDIAGGFTPVAVLHVASDTTNSAMVLQQSTADTDSFDLRFYKTRGTVGSQSAITTADPLGLIRFYGYSGAAGLVEGARISAISEGTI